MLGTPYKHLLGEAPCQGGINTSGSSVMLALAAVVPASCAAVGGVVGGWPRATEVGETQKHIGSYQMIVLETTA